MLVRIIAFTSLLLYLGPVIRFRSHSFFYFFFMIFVTPAVLYLIRLVNSTWTIAFFPITALVVLFSYPLINLKIKAVLAFPTIVSFLHLVDSPLISFISVEVIFLYMTLDLVFWLYKEINKRHQFFVYELLLAFEFFLDGLKVFIYFENILLLTKMYPIFTLVSSLIPILLTIFGPHYIFRTRALEFKRTKDIGTKYDLTPREIEILHLISLGLTSKEIAEKLFISEKTTKNHRAHIKMKLRCLTKADMVKIYNEEIFDVNLVQKYGNR